MALPYLNFYKNRPCGREESSELREIEGIDLKFLGEERNRHHITGRGRD